MAEVFKPIGTETSINTTATAVSTSSRLIRVAFTGTNSTVSNTITCRTGITFNSNTSVDSTEDFITLSPQHYFVDGDSVLYTTSTGNTALTGITNNTTYFITSSNTTGVKLASNTLNAANRVANNITKSVTESGHNLTRTNYVVTIMGGQAMVLEKYTASDTLLGTDGGTNVKAVAIAFTN